MKTIRDIGYLDGVKVLLRVDFNVPIKNGKVVEDFRIRTAIPTIKFLLDKGAIVIAVSHLESSDGGNPSLEPVATRINEMGVRTEFIRDYSKVSLIIDKAGGKKDTLYLLENVRVFKGEKDNDTGFAKELSSLADVYVNDAFSVCHRKHASVVGVPKYIPGYAGFQLEKEISNLSLAFHPSKPFLFILGGAKFSTKLPLLDKFMNLADTVFVGGALANDLFKAKGYEVGRSLVSDKEIDIKGFIDNPKLLLPADVVDENGGVIKADGLSSSGKIMDAGPETIEILKGKIDSSSFILWNGPLGLYEDGYRGATLDLAKAIGARTTNADNVTSIVGGGDTLAAIAALGISEQFSFVSTGGGAMLDFLTDGTLPGILALQDSGD